VVPFLVCGLGSDLFYMHVERARAKSTTTAASCPASLELQPTIIGRATHVSGFTVIVSVLVFGSLFGIIGAIIAVPIAASIEIVLDDAIAKRRARVAASADGQPA
jgi:AI-2E family transporter